MTHNYTEISVTSVNRPACQSCGKRVRISKKFAQTINPFNRLPSGQMKGLKDIHEELCADSEAWKAEPFTCEQCGEQR